MSVRAFSVSSAARQTVTTHLHRLTSGPTPSGAINSGVSGI